MILAGKHDFMQVKNASDIFVHNEYTLIQINRKFYLQKLKKKSYKKALIFFYISVQNIDCEYSLEPPQRGGSNQYPQFMYLSRNKKIINTPVDPSFTT